ncbi:MAG TPA: T9SS type A sorting domain-containing protein [Rubricoccaceae bacterium]
MTPCRTLRPGVIIAIVLAGVLAPTAAAQHETIIVTDSPDVSDFAAPRRVAQLPGPDGRVTFREAVIAASNTPGPQTIAFNIPRSRWDPLFPDGALVFSNIDPFFLDDDSTTIDGRTQTAFTGDTNPTGNEVAFWGEHPNALNAPMIVSHSDGNTFVGLDAMHRRGYGISLADDAEGNRVIGCTISGSTFAAVRIEGSRNTIGGTAPGEGNRLSGGNAAIRIEPFFGAPPPTGNRIIGNTLTGSSGGVQVSAGAVGTLIGGPTPAERNVIAGAGRYFEEGFPGGSQVSVGGSTGTVIEGNYIGTTADGLAAAPNQRGTRGISISNAPNTVIRGNVVAGILVEGINHAAGRLFGVGIEVGPGSPGTVIEGNSIGIGADGITPVPNLNGLEFSGGSSAPVTVGGTTPGAGNTVAHNVQTGLAAWAFVTRLSVSGNAFFGNGLLGIDLQDFSGRGLSLNDVHDPDEQGGNRLQNFPVVQAAMVEAGMLTVTYTVDTAPVNATYPIRVEFFRADSDGTEGALFLGADTYTASDYAAGEPGPKTATLDVSGLAMVSGNGVLATATDAAGNTSEFSVAETAGGAVAAEGSPVRPALALSGPHPNPASGRLALALTVGAATHVRVEALDALGRQVVLLHDGVLTAGTHALALDASALPSGVYVVRANAGDSVVTRRLVVAR